MSDPDTDFESEAATRFDSREQVSYAILCNVLGIESVEFEVEERTGDAAYQTAAHPVGVTTPASAGTDNIIVFHTSETCVHGQGLLKYIISRYEETA